MLDFHEKRKLRSYLYTIPTVGILFLLSGLFSTSVYNRFVSEREIAKKQATASAELAELKSKAAVLEAEVVRLKSERGVEGEIRDRFEVSKKGEQVVVVVGDARASERALKATTTPLAESVPTNEPKGSWWTFLW